MGKRIGSRNRRFKFHEPAELLPLWVPTVRVSRWHHAVPRGLSRGVAEVGSGERGPCVGGSIVWGKLHRWALSQRECQHQARERGQLVGDREDQYSWAVPELFRVCCGPCYIWFSDSRTLSVYRAVEEARGVVHALLIWYKTNARYAAMGRQYKQAHEPFLYCKGPKAKTLWVGVGSESTVWSLKSTTKNKMHPTQKPLSLMMRAIGNHAADLVLDPFAGSGTTGVACKRLNRRCILVEIEERYCEVIVKRLQIPMLGVLK